MKLTLMKMVSMSYNIRTIPYFHEPPQIASINELSPSNSLLGIDSRNISNTNSTFDVDNLQRNIIIMEKLRYLQSPEIGQIRKHALAETVLNEYLYPTYGSNILNGGLLKEWNNEI